MSDAGHLEQKPSRRIWVIAAVTALALHVGGVALAVINLQGDDGEDSLGAQGIEVGLELASQRGEVTDLPPGPESDLAMASPALSEQKAVEKETDLPKEKPTVDEEADRLVTMNESQKPKEDDPKEPTVQQSASPESVQQEQMAPQVYENARESPKPTVVNQGLGKDLQRLSADWQRRLSAHFKNHKVQPDVQRSKDVTVKVHLALNRLGRVLSVVVKESSGDKLYDDAALAMVRRSDPVPRPPAKLTDERFEYDLDVKYDRDKNDKKK